MKNFDGQLLRLKQGVKLTEDQDVATLLGMTKAAFSERKRRDAFPDDKLWALVQTRPELGLDVEYVLTGQQPVDAKAAWLRLKSELGMHEDAAVIEWLGMTAAAVNAYTMRGMFPKQQFLAACEIRPEPVNKDFVLTGVGSAAHYMIDDVLKSRAAGSDPGKERQIIDKYRSDTLFRQAVDALFTLATGEEKTT